MGGETQILGCRCGLMDPGYYIAHQTMTVGRRPQCGGRWLVHKALAATEAYGAGRVA